MKTKNLNVFFVVNRLSKSQMNQKIRLKKEPNFFLVSVDMMYATARMESKTQANHTLKRVMIEQS